MLNNETIGVRLKALREGNSLTVSGLARELGCGRGSIIRWERDRCMLDTYYLIAYMKRFNVSADYILTGEEKLHPDTEKLCARIKAESIKRNKEYMTTGSRYILGFVDGMRYARSIVDGSIDKPKYFIQS
jgi:transcriptional regulator with XRE-family HTH domain